MKAKFTCYWALDGWRWRLKARNGKIIAASSEAFASSRNCRNNAALVRDALRGFTFK